MEMIFHSHANKTHFHKKGCALGLILKVELGSGLLIFAYSIAQVLYIKILTWLQGFRLNLQIFHDFIVLQFSEETWAQKKPNQI